MGIPDARVVWNSSESHDISTPTAMRASWMPMLYGTHQSHMTSVHPLQCGRPGCPFSICIPILYFTLVYSIIDSIYSMFLSINQLLKTLQG